MVCSQALARAAGQGLCWLRLLGVAPGPERWPGRLSRGPMLERRPC